MSRKNVSVPKRWWATAGGWTTRERFVAQYLATSTMRDGAGYFGMFQVTPEALLGALQPGWTAERLEEALAGLEKHKWLVRGDGWIFVPELLVRDQPKSKNEINGAVDDLAGAPRGSLVWVHFLEVAQKHALKLYEKLMLEAASSKLSSAMNTVATPWPPRDHGVSDPVETGVSQGADGVATPSTEQGASGGDARDTTSRPNDGEEPNEETGGVR